MPVTSIPVDSKVRDRLRRYVLGGMTYNDVLTRLMDEHELEAFVRELQKEADAVDDWIPADEL